MKKNYDFSNSIKNPYIKKLKKQVTIRLETDTLEYFKHIAAEIDIPYQKLINLFLRNCAENNKKPEINWKPIKKRAA
jgi:predicted DNA binding CopG/RHH family protein